tara:strand:- start:454 stop:834 length:381 start_codon:yes stop_codon:yes gene_type:complete
MGYTNYHYQKESFTDDEWEYIQHHKKKIIQHFNYIEIEEDTSDDGIISLNGVEENAHETFKLSKERRGLHSWENEEDGAFSFCKTNRKPYDKIVWNILLKAHESAPHKITISNDDGEHRESFFDKE